MKYNEPSIHDIIEQELITTLYQPIISLINGEIIGYEALSRGPKDTALYSPVALIQKAEEISRIWELEMIFRKRAIEKAIHIPSCKLLFINVDPNIMLDANYEKGMTKSYLEKYKINVRDIVFEITERSAIEDYPSFKKIINHYRSQEYNIAIDDVGSGYSGLKSITELKPNFVKIDMDLIRDIDTDVFKKSIIKGLVSVAKDTGLQLIAEGVETHAELRTVIELGVHNAQGYLLHRPSEEVAHELSDIRNMILRIKREAIGAFSYDKAYYIIGKISKHTKCIAANTPCVEVKDFFDRSDFDSIAIGSTNTFPEGLIMKSNFHSKLAGRYGFDLYVSRPIKLLMNVRPLIVDFYTPVNEVLSLAMQRNKKHLYDDILVTKGSKYIGTVTIYDIIRYNGEFEKMYTKQLNPLTSLPGNMIIRQVLEQFINNSEIVGLLYIDIDYFKSYNDIYGFEEGDVILRNTGQLIEQIVHSHSNNHFVGHIGGDDFVAIINDNHSVLKDISIEICNTFDEMIAAFFNAEDRQNGYYLGKDRFDTVQKFPLTSITIAGCYGSLATFQNVEHVGQFMGNTKREAKSMIGSSHKIVLLD